MASWPGSTRTDPAEPWEPKQGCHSHLSRLATSTPPAPESLPKCSHKPLTSVPTHPMLFDKGTFTKHLPEAAEIMCELFLPRMITLASECVRKKCFKQQSEWDDERHKDKFADRACVGALLTEVKDPLSQSRISPKIKSYKPLITLQHYVNLSTEYVYTLCQECFFKSEETFNTIWWQTDRFTNLLSQLHFPISSAD